MPNVDTWPIILTTQRLANSAGLLTHRRRTRSTAQHSTASNMHTHMHAPTPPRGQPRGRRCSGFQKCARSINVTSSCTASWRTGKSTVASAQLGRLVSDPLSSILSVPLAPLLLNSDCVHRSPCNPKRNQGGGPRRGRGEKKEVKKEMPPKTPVPCMQFHLLPKVLIFRPSANQSSVCRASARCVLSYLSMPARPS